ncbi:MAG: hypothetical protein HW387_1136 [Parachlamydiales bacterium]|nr:hypothetical protein [Parachlamydiales bacterium]
MFSVFHLDSDQKLECSICQESITSASDIVAHESGGNRHPIHRSCFVSLINACAMQSTTALCPLCRRVIVQLDQVVIGNVEASPELTISRLKKCILPIILLLRKLGPYINVEKMINNTIEETSYYGKDQFGRHVNIGCNLDFTINIQISLEGSTHIPQGQDTESVTQRFVQHAQEFLLRLV